MEVQTPVSEDHRRPGADDTERLRVQVAQLESRLNQMDAAGGGWRDAEGAEAGSVWSDGSQTLSERFKTMEA